MCTGKIVSKDLVFVSMIYGSFDFYNNVCWKKKTEHTSDKVEGITEI